MRNCALDIFWAEKINRSHLFLEREPPVEESRAELLDFFPYLCVEIIKPVNFGTTKVDKFNWVILAWFGKLIFQFELVRLWLPFVILHLFYAGQRLRLGVICRCSIFNFWFIRQYIRHRVSRLFFYTLAFSLYGLNLCQQRVLVWATIQGRASGILSIWRDRRDHYVLGFQVSVCYSVLLELNDGLNNFPDNFLNLLFWQAIPHLFKILVVHDILKNVEVVKGSLVS